MTLFERTVSALCYSLADHHDRRPPDLSSYNEVVAFVLAQHQAMPGLLRLGVHIATFGMTLVAVLQASGTPAMLEPLKRGNLIAGWRASRLGPIRDLMRFYESLVVLALLSKRRDV